MMCICTIKAANLPSHAAQEECGARIPHCEVGAPKSSMPPICYTSNSRTALRAVQ